MHSVTAKVVIQDEEEAIVTTKRGLKQDWMNNNIVFWNIWPKCFQKKKMQARCWWLMSAILAAGEAEIRRITVWSQS
jgi:hypothetical protein